MVGVVCGSRIGVTTQAGGEFNNGFIHKDYYGDDDVFGNIRVDSHCTKLNGRV